jgi:hypothetical protein
MELNKRGLLVLFAGMFLVGLLALACAENDSNDSGRGRPSEMTGAKNMTYGQCVSAAAVVKNSCYGNVKSVYASCNDATANQTDAKNASVQCRTTYKKDMRQCKADFKATKKQECAIIKHNFLETLGSSFK